jgi:hypothetical protein
MIPKPSIFKVDLEEEEDCDYSDMGRSRHRWSCSMLMSGYDC